MDYSLPVKKAHWMDSAYLFPVIAYKYQIRKLSCMTIVVQIQLVLTVDVVLQLVCIVMTNPNVKYPPIQYRDSFMTLMQLEMPVWFTVLVCLDYGRGVNGGGDFGFGSVGHVLQCKHGDVFVYNPTHPHGTTEFDLHPNEPESGRIFFAFFMKKNVLHADLLSQAMVNRVGVQNIKLP